MAYEPGSIFKAFTVAIGLDTDEIRLYDFYHDPGEVKV
jgi:cell division protein FtsI/penicillin-binding protein 2